MDIQSNREFFCTIILLLLTIHLSFGKDELHCFKKLHDADDAKKGPICRRIIYKSTSSGKDKPFRRPNRCCNNGGIGYKKGELVRIGKKGLKYPCTLCPNAKPTTIAVSIAPSLTTAAREGWSDWSEWGTCSVTCKVGTKRRERECYSVCVGDSTDQTPCVLASDCPVDGSWGPWNEWGACSAVCGGGNRIRYRRCNDPSPSHGGQDCQGSSDSTESCASNPCAVNGGWSEWTVYPCSVTCGKGVIVQNRSCDNPAPQNNGSQCQGPQTKSEKCRGLPKCPIDGQWSIWSAWGSCTASCGEGMRTRERDCVAPKPKHGGANCTGNDTYDDVCYHPTPCPVDGGWTDWDPWSSCLAEPCTGEKGYTTRKRTCKNPLPRYGGVLCEGDNNETQECTNNEGCPVDGNWCDWTDYSQCLVSDLESFKIKTRECGCPVPESGGKPCIGIDFETENCLTDDETRIRCQNRQIQEEETDSDSSGYIPDEDC